MFTSPGNQEDEAHAGADSAVGDIESREADFASAALLEVEVEEIDDVMDGESVDEITDDTAEDESKGDLAQGRSGIEMMATENQDDQGDDGDRSEDEVVATEEAPGRAGIPPINQFKEALDDDLFFAGFEKANNELFSELVQRGHKESNGGNAAVGCSKNKLQ